MDGPSGLPGRKLHASLIIHGTPRESNKRPQENKNIRQTAVCLARQAVHRCTQERPPLLCQSAFKSGRKSGACAKAHDSSSTLQKAETSRNLCCVTSVIAKNALKRGAQPSTRHPQENQKSRRTLLSHSRKTRTSGRVLARRALNSGQ